MVDQFEPEMAITPPFSGIEWARGRGVSATSAAAFEEILAHDLHRLYRLAFGMLRNREDAEDALQEALWKAFRRLPTFEGRSSLSTWITRIVINSALMTLRRKKSHLEFSLDEMLERQPETLALGAAEKRPNPEQTYAAAELVEMTRNQLLRLPVSEQAAFRHVVINGHSTKESASTFGVPTATFKSRILRTRRKLARGINHSPNKARTASPMEKAVHAVQQ
jgi:RNA polymerase sigma-70 factor (ECF subfamily)